MYKRVLSVNKYRKRSPVKNAASPWVKYLDKSLLNIGRRVSHAVGDSLLGTSRVLGSPMLSQGGLALKGFAEMSKTPFRSVVLAGLGSFKDPRSIMRLIGTMGVVGTGYGSYRLGRSLANTIAPPPKPYYLGE